jgi:hypothetical protein
MDFGKTTPSVIFAPGTVLEDRHAVMEVLYRRERTRVGHLYKVKILEWKTPIPEQVKQHMDNPNEILIVLTEEILPNIKIVR